MAQNLMRFETIPARSLADYERLGCATEGCAKHPVCYFEAGGVGSYFCADCACKVAEVFEKAG